MLYRIAIITVIATMFGIGTLAHACSCHLATAHSGYEGAAAVFVGKAEASTRFGRAMQFTVEESFWGVQGKTIEIRHYDPIQCDSFAFKVGRRYLVVAYKKSGPASIFDHLESILFPFASDLTATTCNQALQLELATGDIRVLRLRQQGRPLPRVYGVVIDRNGSPVKNTTVTIRAESNAVSKIAPTKTDADGYFEFQSLPEGSYEAEAQTINVSKHFSLDSLSPGARVILY